VRTAFAVIALVCAVSFTAAARQATSVRRHRRRAHPVRQSQPKVIPAPVPLPPEPPPPPILVVSYQHGSLALTAQDVPLSEILERIRESSGAVIEAPSLDQRMTVRLGPQPPVQIIRALLQGLNLNFAILGGTSDRDPLQHIILALKPQLGSRAAAPALASQLEDAATQARARALIRLAETGGDEGVWDDESESPPPAVAPSSPAPRKPAHE
jgi:hypothetical protein